MQINISEFFKLSSQQLNEIKSLEFWDHEKELDEDFSSLTDNDFINLCDLLANCSQLSTLELCDNNIGNLEPSRIARLVQSIGFCGQLKNLDLSNNNLHNLKLDAWRLLLGDLSKLVSLEVLVLNGNYLRNLKAACLDPIFDLLPKQISRVDLAWNELGNSNLLDIFTSKILTYPNLLSLNLSDNQLFNCPQQIINLFTNLNSIKKLDLSYNDLGLAKDHVFPPVVVSNHLEDLNISNNQLGQSIEFFSFIMRQLSKIKDLDLSCNQIESLIGNIKFSSYQHLEVLSLGNNDFTTFEQLSFMNLIDDLNESKSIKELDLSDTNLINLSIEDFNYLFAMLINHQHLKILHLDANRLGLTCVAPKLGELLRQNKFTKLDLSYNLLGKLPSNDWQHILAGLVESIDLVELNIGFNDFEHNSQSLIRLIKSLQHCVNLKKLNLGGNDIKAASAWELQDLLAGLSYLPKLSTLDLSYSLIDSLRTTGNLDMLLGFIRTSTNLKSLTLEQDVSHEVKQQIQQTVTNRPSFKLKFK